MWIILGLFTAWAARGAQGGELQGPGPEGRWSPAACFQGLPSPVPGEDVGLWWGGRGPAVLSESEGPSGSRVALVRCSRFGRAGDMWLVLGDRRGWREALFTGDATGEWGGSVGVRLRGVTLSIEHDSVTATVRTGAPLDPPRAERVQGFTWRLADLRADADRDGLSDVLERRLGTDARALDSDRDGVADAEDDLPIFDDRTPASPSDAVLAAALNTLARDPKLRDALGGCAFVRLAVARGRPALHRAALPFPVLPEPCTPRKRCRRALGDVVPHLRVRATHVEPDGTRASIDLDLSVARSGQSFRFEFVRRGSAWTFLRRVRTSVFVD